MNIIDKYKKMSVQAKAGIWFVLCSCLQKGISFITVPIFTKLLTSEEYGTYSVYLSWLHIISIITSLNLFYGVLDNGMSKFDKDRDRFISSMQGLTITITTVFLLIFVAASDFWAGLLHLAPIYILLMFVEMYLTPCIMFWSGRQRFEYRYKRLVIITFSKSLANPLLGIIMVFLMKDRALARVISVVIVESAFCLVILIVQFLKGKVFFDKSYWKYGLKLAVPMLPHYMSGIILNQGDRIMIENMVSKSAVAYYSVAYSIGMLVQVFTSAINSAITPWVYSKMKTNDDSGVAERFNGLLLLVAGVSVCLMVVSPELMLIFGKEEYIQGAAVIPPVAASVFFIFLYYLFSLPQFYFEKTKFLAIASVIAAILNIILNYIFISMFGYFAAGYTTLACYILYSVGHYFVSKNVLKHNMAGKKLYDIKIVIIISILLILFGVAVNFIFDYPVIRYCILLIGCIICFLNRRKIINLIKTKK